MVPLFYEGVIAGSEFLTYAATKLYLCLEFSASYTSTAGVAPAYINFYNELNAAFNAIHKNSVLWNATGATINYCPVQADKENFYFARFLNGVYIYMKFNGYRLTIA
jgi:hypothetical protein